MIMMKAIKIVLVSIAVLLFSVGCDLTAGKTFPNSPFKTEVAEAGVIYGDSNSDRIYDAPECIYDSRNNLVYTVR